MNAQLQASVYDDAIFNPANRSLYEGTDFFNVGYWGDNRGARAQTLSSAAFALVQLHLRSDLPGSAQNVSTVIDMGCGLGAGTDMIALHYSRALVLGVNFSLRQAAYAAKTYPRARFAVMDAVRLGFPAGSVDRIHCVEAAFHFASRWEFFAEAQRVLRPGGYLAVTDILFRRKTPHLAAENVCTEISDYLERSRRTGLAVEHFADITRDTLVPFFALLTQSGFEREARALRSVQKSYYHIVFRKV